jgi:hypothetical protein
MLGFRLAFRNTTMKKHTLFLVLQFWSICLLGQVPLGISFQGVVRNSTNEIIDNEAIKIRFTITKGTSTGPEVFKEIHATTTNNNGLFSLVIGNGTIENGALNTIIWSDGPYFLKREIDIDSDGNYEIVGDSEFWTVPYSFYASASDSSRIADSVVYKQEISGSNDTIFLSDGGVERGLVIPYL